MVIKKMISEYNKYKDFKDLVRKCKITQKEPPKIQNPHLWTKIKGETNLAETLKKYETKSKLYFE
jgi:signal recognition particle subunit SEC65